MSTELRERLEDLADQAPSAVRPPHELWRAGVRRSRRRRAAAMAAAVVGVLAVGGVGVLSPVTDRSVPPADAPAAELRLPRTIHMPSPWVEGTAEAGPPGPLAVVSLAPRNSAVGLTGSRETLEPYGISAADGSAVFLDLPGSEDPQGGTRLGIGAIALSPDGRKVAYVRHQATPPAEEDLMEVALEPPVGWDVYDTVTGEITRLRVPGMKKIRGTDVFEIRFSGDSRYLLTNYSPTGSSRSRDDALVVWDVETGERVVAEGTGHYWLPNPGSGPDGIVWARGQQVLTFSPETGETTSVTLPHQVVEASYGPDGRALAYIGKKGAKVDSPGPWHLAVGETAETTRQVDLGFEPGQVLGWRSDREVVVWDRPRRVAYVDVGTGEVTRHFRFGDRTAGSLMTPLLAADLWRNPLVDGERTTARDPRWWLRRPPQVAAAVGAAGVVGAWLVRRRRVRD